MSQTISVNLMFNANTQAARQNVTELAGLLKQIGSTTNIGINSGALSQAAQAARELQVHLGNAVNVDTGKLNLVKFNTSLQQGNQSLTQLSSKLITAGTQGQQAFVGLARSIAQAQAPAFSLGATLGNLVKTIGSAAMWSAAYGAINMFTQAISGAIDYAKDLNKALTDIAIVSDLTADDLVKFTEAAGKASKQLKTTTKDYAEAALIFYQQGLNSKEVEERTNAVIKMAHVTGQTAKVVSDQLTAIWNNFDNGTKSLEYYVDVITALGAATASSTDEIAQGLEKFAAIAETVGLSYEYATAALATVTAETRQSADVVGTAFKTLFARIQDLELGKTLEDGVSLGQYSQALNAIGVSALDVNGNLREMDDILNDMGAKWDSLTTAQKTATAQSVAGVRQYTQLIALMDNWEEFQININVAETAEGTLEIQQEKWAKSAEAAAERVAEATNQLYSQVLSDETVINVTNSFADLLEIIERVVDSVGGFGPLIITLIALFSRQLLPLVLNASNSIINGLNILTGATERQVQATQNLFFKQIEQYEMEGKISSALAQEVSLSKDLMLAKRQMESATKGLTAVEKENLNNRLAMYEAMNNEAAAMARKSASSKAEANDAKDAILGLNRGKARTASRDQYDSRINAANEEFKTVDERKGYLEEQKSRTQLNEQEEQELKTLTARYDQLIEKVQRLKAEKEQVNSTDINELSLGEAAVERDTFNQGLEERQRTLAAMQSANVTGAAMEQDNIYAEASVNNLERVIKKRAELDNAVQKNTNTIKELQIAQANGESISFTEDEIQDYQKLASSIGMTGDEVKELTAILQSGDNSAIEKALRDLNQGAEMASSGLDHVEQAIRELIVNVSNPAAVDNFRLALNLSEKDAIELANQLKILAQEKQRLDTVMNSISGLKNGLASIGAFAGQVSMAISAVMMLRDALDFSEDMDPMQRAMSIAMGVSMLFPVIVSGLNGITNLLGIVKAKKEADAVATKKQAIAEAEKNKQVEKGVGAEVASQAAEASSAAVTKVNTEATKEETIVEAADTQGDIVSIGVDATETAGITTQTGAIEANTAALNKNTIAKNVNSGTRSGGGSSAPSGGGSAPSSGGGSAAKAGSSIGGTLFTLAAIAVVIAGIVALVKEADKIFNKAKNNAAQAAAAASDAAKSYEEMANKYNDLVSAIDEYTSQVTELDELTKGTMEYAEAVSLANDEALKLIDTYKELAGQYKITTDGLIVFNDGVLDNVKATQMQQKNIARSASMYATQNVRQAKSKSTKTDLMRNVIESDSSGEYTDKDKKDTLLGGAVGAGAGGLAGLIAGVKIGTTMAPGWGTLIGAAAGLILGAIGGALWEYENEKEATKREDRALNIIAERYEEIGEAALTKEEIVSALRQKGITDPVLIQSLVNNTAEVKTWVEEIRANTEAIKAENRLRASEYLQSTDKNFALYNKTTQDALIGAFAQAAEGVSTKSADSYRVDGWWATATKEGKDAFSKWAQNQELENAKATNFSGEYIEYEYYDKEQKDTVKKKLTYGELAAWEAAQTSQEKQTRAQSQLYDIILNGNSTGSQALNSFIAYGNLQNLKQKDVEKLLDIYEKVDFSKGWTYSNQIADNGEYARDTQGDTLLEDIHAYAEATGQLPEHVGEEFFKALEKYDPQKAIESYSETAAAERKSLISSSAGALEVEEIALENYSKAILKASDALSTYNDEWERQDKLTAATKIATINARITEGVTQLAEALEDGADAFNNWNDLSLDTWEAVAQVQNALETVFGFKVSGDYVKYNLNKLQNLAQGSTTYLEELREAAAEDFLLNLDIEEVTKKKLVKDLNDFLEGLSPDQKQLGVTLNLQDSEFLSGINNLLATGKVSAEEIQNMFNTIGFDPDIQYRTDRIRNVTEFEYTDGKTNYSGSMSTWTTVTVPYIPGPNTNSTPKYLDASGKEIVYDLNDENSRKQAEKEAYTIQGAMESSTEEQLTYIGGSDIIGAGLNVLQEENKQDKKKLEDEIERYHVIDKTLESLNAEYDKISKAKDRAFGQKYLDYLDAEIKKTNELAETTKTKLAEAQAYLEKDRAAILKYGVSLDENGTITNYEDVFAAQIKQYNSNPDKYEEAYEKFKKDLEQYEETISTIRDLESQVEDYMNQEFDLKLQGIQYKVDLQLRLSDNDQKLIDFLQDNLTDSVTDVLTKFSLMKQSMIGVENNAAAAVEGIKETLGLSDISLEELMSLSPDTIASMIEGKNLTEEQVAQLEGQLDTLYEQVGTMREMYNEVSENLLAAFEDMNKEFEKSIDNLDHMNSLVESFYDMIDLVGEKTLGINKEMLSDMKKTQLELSKSQMQVSKAQLEQNKKSLDEIAAKLEEAKNRPENQYSEEEVRELQEAFDEIQATVQENEQSFIESVTSTLEMTKAVFEQELDNTLFAFESSMTGAYKTFESLREAYDQRKEIDDLYLEDYQKIYELSKLTRDINNSIDESDSIRAKERLRDLQEEINALQESNSEMTQYEVDALRAKYELRLAEIALEEAQNAKSQVRMQRDANGNWGYVYTADSEAVDSAQQNYEDKLYAYQNTIQENVNEMEERLISLPQEYADAAREIFEKYGDDTELYNLKMKELTEHYLKLQEHILDQLGKSLEDAATLHEEDWTNYNRLTGYKISKDEEWRDSFKETITAQIIGLGELEEYQKAFEQGTSIVLQEVQQHYLTYQTEVAKILEDAFGDIEEFFGTDDNKGLRRYLKMAQSYAEDTAIKAKEMGDANANAFKKAVEAAAAFLEQYAPIVSEWNKTTGSIGSAVNAVERAYSTLRGELKLIEDKYKDIEQAARAALDAMNQVSGGDPSPKPEKAAIKVRGLDADDPNKSIYSLGVEKTVEAVSAKELTPGFGSTKGMINNESVDLYDAEVKLSDGTTKKMYLTESELKKLGVTVQKSKPKPEEPKFAGWKKKKIDKEIENYSASFLTKSGNLWINDSGTYGGIPEDNVDFKTMYFNGDPTDPNGIEDGLYFKDTNGNKAYPIEFYEPIESDINTMWHYYNGERGLSIKSLLNNKKLEDLSQEVVDAIENIIDVHYDSFDTGGYTGSWDSSGRIAMLHQKELVLNAKDTVNFLAAVDILRDITKAIDLQALSQANLLGSIAAASVSPTGQVIEQEVTIHAEFPNATNHSEIEEAFSTLLNRASQFANRKN